jgi:hypothetical protein
LPEVDLKVESRRHRAAGDAVRCRLPAKFQADKLAAEFKLGKGEAAPAAVGVAAAQG